MKMTFSASIDEWTNTKEQRVSDKKSFRFVFEHFNESRIDGNSILLCVSMSIVTIIKPNGFI